MNLISTLRPYFVCVLVAVLATGCASGSLLRGPSYEQAPKPKISAGLGTVYFIRKSSTIYNYPINKMIVNGEEVVALTDQEFSWVQLPEGRHRLQERGRKTNHDTFIDVKGGETYYVLFDFYVDKRIESYGENTTLTDAEISFGEVDVGTAEAALRRSSFKEADADAVRIAATRAQPSEVAVGDVNNAGFLGAAAGTPAAVANATPSEAPPPVTGPATSTGAPLGAAAGVSPAGASSDARHYIVALYYVARGKEDDFREFERQALLLMAAYGGRIEQSIAPETIQGDMNPPNVVHLQVFESASGYERFRADPRWKELEQLRANVTTDSVILRGRRLTVDPAASLR